MGLFTANLCVQISRSYLKKKYLLDFELPNIKQLLCVN